MVIDYKIFKETEMKINELGQQLDEVVEVDEICQISLFFIHP